MKILIVDDSALLRNILREVISKNSDIKVVGEASNGRQAVDRNESLAPDLIIMDINMPVMDGIAATREIMENRPAHILILSSVLDASSSFNALKNGALEVMKKPDIDQFNDPNFYRDFIEKIRALALAPIRPAASSSTAPIAAPLGAAKLGVIVMGASTGGPLTVCSILGRLSADYPIGISLVQHLEQGFDRGFADWLGSETKLKVRIAGADDFPGPGELIVAPAGSHLVVRGGKFVLDDGPAVLNQKPSVDLLFKSAAEFFRESLTGVLLTGMGSDGADGCVAIMARGGTTLVQDKSTSTIFGMPRVAIERGGASRVLTSTAIGDYLLRLGEKA